jgi:hypothetical protein
MTLKMIWISWKYIIGRTAFRTGINGKIIVEKAKTFNEWSFRAGKRTRRQCTYHVTLRRFRVNTVAVEKKYYIFSVCVCSLSYPVCKSHTPYYTTYCHLWPVWLYHLLYYLINCAVVWKKSYWTYSLCFGLLYNFCLEQFSELYS